MSFIKTNYNFIILFYQFTAIILLFSKYYKLSSNIVCSFILDDLKTLIYAKSGIPCCQQTLTGWPNNQFPINKDILAELNLPDRFRLNLMTNNEDPPPQELSRRYINVIPIVTYRLPEFMLLLIIFIGIVYLFFILTCNVFIKIYKNVYIKCHNGTYKFNSI